ncbi:glycosyltransferase family 2 protein [Silvibacterium dinghuense]|uniref:Glycosyltransferase n=1 Tax=Silvibacterium dinghuense TaxID=1560006 RepID=A0A4V1NVG5_9BACT|nr:glycosyltransferase family 2 protein [Silvibacterium dinghuense]RXS95690.1 glycosyltransferase [Silvibacterium dinghuense]GGH14951.1 rhamnosyltransferase [Silvibacterium dinghuense]
MEKTIAAVVVTYNRKVLLGSCLNALLSQTRLPKMVYVIDNASTDGTKQYIKELGYLENPRIRYVPLARNLGGAGGFRSGMEIAVRDGYDYLWIMDDDAEPKLDALERMMPFVAREDISALANLKVDSDGAPQIYHLGNITWNPFVDLVKPLSPTDYANKQSLDIQFSSFVGLLISRRAIELKGLPRSDFYIHCDDFEYCVRLNHVGQMLLIPDSVIVHNSPRAIPARKRFLMLTAAPDTLKASCFRYYGERNSTWVVKTYSPLGWLGAFLWATTRIARRTIKATIFERDHYWTRLHVLIRGFTDGLISHFDNSFPTQIINAKMNPEGRE